MRGLAFRKAIYLSWLIDVIGYFEVVLVGKRVLLIVILLSGGFEV